MIPRILSDRLNTIASALEADGFEIAEDGIVPPELIHGSIGLVAEHREATNYDDKQPKRVYYLEGRHEDMGFAMGYLAADEIHRMTTQYIDGAIWEMICGCPPHAREGEPTLTEQELHRFLINLVSGMIGEGRAIRAVPPTLKRELRGIAAGCKHAKVPRDVSLNDLWVLNVGFDCLLAHLYTLSLPKLQKPAMRRLLRTPLACNGLALLNGAAEPGPLFGRDFMFPTGRVFQDVACLTIYNPLPQEDRRSLPMVAMTAPGMVGSIAAMNIHGVAAGVDVVPAGNANPVEIGVNSLLLVRHAIETGDSAEEAVGRILDSPRGVPWLYPVAAAGRDATPDRACVVEAGMSTDMVNYLSYPRDSVKNHLPSQGFLNANPSAIAQEGAMVRWQDFVYPEKYVEKFNPKLWRWYRKKLYPDAFTRTGYINRAPEDENCPSAFYFSPLRAKKDHVVIVSNHYVCPEMRLCAMGWWTSKLAGKAADDSQWRYDELNHQTLSELQAGPISYAKAKALIDFLSPYGRFPGYHAKNPKSKDGKESAIGGSVCLFDLERRTIESHFGYYCDDWVKITLPNFIASDAAR